MNANDIADELINTPFVSTRYEAAAMLRRQAAEIERLTKVDVEPCGYLHAVEGTYYPTPRGDTKKFHQDHRYDDPLFPASALAELQQQLEAAKGLADKYFFQLTDVNARIERLRTQLEEAQADAARLRNELQSTIGALRNMHGDADESVEGYAIRYALAALKE
jgi:hypothetical protein